MTFSIHSNIGLEKEKIDVFDKTYSFYVSGKYCIYIIIKQFMSKQDLLGW